MTFYGWLQTQSKRADDVGALARHAQKDRLFPRRAKRLYLFLSRYDGQHTLRDAVKLAHTEYRQIGGPTL